MQRREKKDETFADEESAPIDSDEQKKSVEAFDALLSPLVDRSGGELPKRIRRYRIIREIGRGSFGRVFLGSDDQLQREVAIKVPVGQFLNDPARSADYLNEARTIAGLDHPNIVPVYDIGSCYDYPCYIVTKYIQGQSLGQLMREKTLTLEQSIRLLIPVARALHFAHRNGVIHRDIKPDNILLDKDRKPYVVDLGLALTEKLATQAAGIVGTPAYMSPEQARGEGHRVDGRTDIYSMGVVLYELLLGRRPFKERNISLLIKRIAYDEPTPPRQIDDSLPKQLERICLRAIARMARDRYTTALDLATDLSEYLAECSVQSSGSSQSQSSNDSNVGESRHPTLAGIGNSTQKEPIIGSQASRVIPKGPQAFDGHDADFFLQLLPGPHDREGVPQSIRLWKSAIEQPDNPFRVGLLYGPSGAGKSSFIQAGLVPVLTDSMNVCYVQATAQNTEESIASMLKRRFPEIDGQKSLTQIMTDLRLGNIKSEKVRVLIVIDQFEQWLAQHLNQSGLQSHELVQALRQCDGENVQCLLTIRDDFWMAITEFFAHLEIDLVNGQNCRGIERFDLPHAEKVLHAFGVAFGKLPESTAKLIPSQRKFLHEAIGEFAENGRVACVAIALLAEMLKSSEWNAETIRQIGGIRGLGVAYLERHFRGPDASPQNRAHELAIRRSLQLMLPADESSIKGSAVSKSEIANVAGYELDSTHFATLIRILEERLVTAVDDASLETNHDSGPREVKYQLAHDFFVPAIRDWIHDSQSRSPAGRAEQSLQQRTRSWQVKPENQRLPSPIEFAQIVRHTSRGKRAGHENKMMSAAWRYYLTRLGAIAAIVGTVAAVGLGYFWKVKQDHRLTQTATLIENFNTAPADAVPFALQNFDKYKSEARDLLQTQFESGTQHEKLRAAIALSNLGDVRSSFLITSFEEVDQNQTPMIVNALDRSSSRSQAIEIVKQRIDVAQELRTKIRLHWLLADLTNIASLNEVLRVKPDSTARSTAIVDMRLWDHDWTEIAESIRTSDDVDLVSGLIMGLVGIEKRRIPRSTFSSLVTDIQKKFQSHPEAIIHSSTKSLLNRWEISLPDVAAVAKTDDQKWFASNNNLTMIYVPSGNFLRQYLNRGSKTLIVETPFWISDTEVTAELFLQFYNDPKVKTQDRLKDWVDIGETLLKTEYHGRGYENLYTKNHPIKRVCLEDAILFCNWLSRNEGLQECYERTGKKLKIHRRLRENEEMDEWELNLDADGYRLPSILEFEYARNANSNQLFPFGSDWTLAHEFCVFSPSGTNTRLLGSMATGSRLPNPFGLFDMCGNMEELCHPMHQRSGKVDTLIDSDIDATTGLNSWGTTEKNYATNQVTSLMEVRSRIFGFRVVRQAQISEED